MVSPRRRVFVLPLSEMMQSQLLQMGGASGRCGVEEGRWTTETALGLTTVEVTTIRSAEKEPRFRRRVWHAEPEQTEGRDPVKIGLIGPGEGSWCLGVGACPCPPWQPSQFFQSFQSLTGLRATYHCYPSRAILCTCMGSIIGLSIAQRAYRGYVRWRMPVGSLGKCKNVSTRILTKPVNEVIMLQ